MIPKHIWKIPGHRQIWRNLSILLRCEGGRFESRACIHHRTEWRGGQAKDSSRRPPGQSLTEIHGKILLHPIVNMIVIRWSTCFFAYGHERLATGRSSYLIWWRAVMVRWCKRRLQSWWVPLSIVLSCCNVTWFWLNLLLDSAAFWLSICCWNYSQSRLW